MDKNVVGSAFEDALPEHLRRVAGDPSELDTFRHWFTRALWDAESTAPDDILSLAYRIENLIGIVDAGVWTERELLAGFREELARNDAAHGKHGHLPAGTHTVVTVVSVRSGLGTKPPRQVGRIAGGSVAIISSPAFSAAGDA